MSEYKSIEILALDAELIHLLADLEGREVAEVMHSALEKYFRSHAPSAAIFKETQELIKSGDIDLLTKALQNDLLKT